MEVFFKTFHGHHITVLSFPKEIQEKLFNYYSNWLDSELDSLGVELDKR